MELALLTFEKIIAMFIILIIGVLCYKLKFISIEGNKSLFKCVIVCCKPCNNIYVFPKRLRSKAY